MTVKRIRISWFAMVLLFAGIAAANAQEPSNPNATPEARALLKYLQGLSGKHTLSGQHNYPATGSSNTDFVTRYIGETPVVWSQDFGFSADDKDSYLSRPAIIQEAIRQYKNGHIINLCWHAVPPTADEPITFQPKPGSDPAAPLASVQGRLTDKQWHDILTPGTDLYKKWARQVDVIASFLKQLQDAKVPVLWRPYHEMNGDWFWWGGRYEGKYTTAALYRQIYDRMVKVHKLNNLVWLWNVDRPTKPGREFSKYYPGNKYLDIVSIDIYGNDFNQAYYDSLMVLSKGKPMAFGEVGNPPSVDILSKQPNWIYWVVWAGMAHNTPVPEYEKLMADPRMFFMEDKTYIDGMIAYRKACGLEPLAYRSTVDFSGTWILNTDESDVAQNPGPTGAIFYRMSLTQSDSVLKMKLMSVEEEYNRDEITEEKLTLNGKDNVTNVSGNALRIQNANWSPDKDNLIIDSRMTLTFGGKTSEIKGREVWYLLKQGRKLVIVKTVNDEKGTRTIKQVYDRGC
jgi:hypothetical protein